MSVVVSDVKRRDTMDMVDSIAPGLSEGEDAMDTDVWDWEGLDWTGIVRSVNRTQARIVKAQMEGRHRLVRRLQHLLLTSFGARCIAVREVTERADRNTTGGEDTVPITSAEKFQVVEGLMWMGRRPSSSGSVPMNDGVRDNRVATTMDRAIQELVALVLEPICKAGPVNGYAAYHSILGIAQGTFDMLSRGSGVECVVMGTIEYRSEHTFRNWVRDNVSMDPSMMEMFLDTVHFTEDGDFPPYTGRSTTLLLDMMLGGIPHHSVLLRYRGEVVLICADMFEAYRTVDRLIGPLSERGLTISIVRGP